MFGLKTLASVGFAVAMLGWSMAPTTASAVTFQVNGISTDASATIDFTYDGVNTLTVGITNTANSFTDPRITAFAFNAPTSVTGFFSFSASGTANNTDWEGLFDRDDVQPPQNVGDFDAAGITGNNFQGGSPNSGITLGNTGTFVIQLTGDATDLAMLTADSFLGLSSVNGNSSWPFAVRFQRLDGQPGSDVAVGGPSPIPLPAAAWMLLAGLGGIAALKRRRSA